MLFPTLPTNATFADWLRVADTTRRATIITLTDSEATGFEAPVFPPARRLFNKLCTLPVDTVLRMDGYARRRWLEVVGQVHCVN